MTRRRWSWVLLLVWSDCAAAASSTCPPEWVSTPPMPNPRQMMAAAAAGGKLYVIGGISSTSLIASTDIFDPATSTWASGAPIPTPRSLAAAVECAGRVYVAGGQGSTFYCSTLESYDPSTDTWTTLAPMHSARSWFVLACVSGELLAIGGVGSGPAYDEAYDPSLSQWRELGPIRVGSVTAYGVVNGRVYILDPPNVMVYDPATEAWTTKGPTPYLHSSFPGCAVAGNRIYELGGYGPTGYSGAVLAYLPEFDQWVNCTPLGVPRESPIGVTIGNRVYAIGGLAGMFGAPVDTVESAVMPTPVAPPACQVAPNNVARHSWTRIYLRGQPGEKVELRVYDAAGEFEERTLVILDSAGYANIPYYAGDALGSGPHWLIARGSSIHERCPFMVKR